MFDSMNHAMTAYHARQTAQAAQRGMTAPDGWTYYVGPGEYGYLYLHARFGESVTKVVLSGRRFAGPWWPFVPPKSVQRRGAKYLKSVIR